MTEQGYGIFSVQRPFGGRRHQIGRRSTPRFHPANDFRDDSNRRSAARAILTGARQAIHRQSTQPAPPLRERRFIRIDRDNFDDVMKRLVPGINMRVENALEGDGRELALQLRFTSMKDFEPAAIRRVSRGTAGLSRVRRGLVPHELQLETSIRGTRS
jgi:hypothetical protein